MKNTQQLIKTLDTQTLIDSQNRCYRMLQEYSSEPISTRTEYNNKFYKRIENDLKFIIAEIKSR